MLVYTYIHVDVCVYIQQDKKTVHFIMSLRMAAAMGTLSYRKPTSAGNLGPALPQQFKYLTSHQRYTKTCNQFHKIQEQLLMETMQGLLYMNVNIYSCVNFSNRREE